MKQACIRCVVQLTLDELRWKDERGIDIQLTGPPVFLRACILGQLQHTHLHKPLFPIAVNQTLTFDRILSNCRNPSLFNEVIRGEHAKLEVIQITPDYRGGKILAKFDCPAHQFLYPNGKEMEEEQRIMVLNHSKHYRVPPELSYSSSTVLLEATVNSPIHVLFPDSLSSEEESSDNEALTLAALHKSRSPSPRKPRGSRRQLFSPGHTGARVTSGKSLCSRGGAKSPRGRGVSPAPQQASVAGMSESLSTQERLHSLLSSYVEPQESPLASGPVMGQSPYRVKFKPASHRSRRELEDPVEDSVSPPPPPPRHGPPYYISPGQLMGPHHWTQCPRRSPKHTRRGEEEEAPRSRSVSPYHRNCTPPTSPARAPKPRSTRPYDPTNSPPRPPRPRSPSPYTPPASPRPLRHQSPSHYFIPTSPRPTRLRSASPISRPRSTSPHRHKSTTLQNGVPLYVLKNTKDFQRMDPALRPLSKSLSDVRPPFVVRHVDESWLSKRDFCGTAPLPMPLGIRELSPSGPGVERGEGHLSSGIGEDANERQNKFSSDEVGGGSRSEFRASPMDHQGGPCGRGQMSTSPERGKPLGRVQSSPNHKFPYWSESPHSPIARGIGSAPCVGGRGREDVVSRYLPRTGTELHQKCSLAGTIEERIEKLKKECCEFLRCPDSLGEDSLSEDLDRLQASLQGERDEALERSSRLIPDKSVTVQIGPRDYWSQRMSQLTGTKHRVIFDQTLQKIYNRLYTEASMTP